MQGYSKKYQPVKSNKQNVNKNSAKIKSPFGSPQDKKNKFICRNVNIYHKTQNNIDKTYSDARTKLFTIFPSDVLIIIFSFLGIVNLETFNIQRPLYFKTYSLRSDIKVPKKEMGLLDLFTRYSVLENSIEQHKKCVENKDESYMFIKGHENNLKKLFRSLPEPTMNHNIFAILCMLIIGDLQNGYNFVNNWRVSLYTLISIVFPNKQKRINRIEIEVSGKMDYIHDAINETIVKYNLQKSIYCSEPIETSVSSETFYFVKFNDKSYIIDRIPIVFTRTKIKRSIFLYENMYINFIQFCDALKYKWNYISPKIINLLQQQHSQLVLPYSAYFVLKKLSEEKYVLYYDGYKSIVDAYKMMNIASFYKYCSDNDLFTLINIEKKTKDTNIYVKQKDLKFRDVAELIIELTLEKCTIEKMYDNYVKAITQLQKVFLIDIVRNYANDSDLAREVIPYFNTMLSYQLHINCKKIFTVCSKTHESETYRKQQIVQYLHYNDSDSVLSSEDGSLELDRYYSKIAAENMKCVRCHRIICSFWNAIHQDVIKDTIISYYDSSNDDEILDDKLCACTNLTQIHITKMKNKLCKYVFTRHNTRLHIANVTYFDL